ncbi:MAG: hypothetical protein Q7T42_05910 [Methylotenera sp.]|uniref:hypothetical protein n=1 Tax=Methylotenera sp. TaxID=2051956 RepID=UPI0027205F52|nr:hypothetical protein [Methylotenera sp.]MDO9393493.1 hypothetical protein [Methylotenera sp.]
MFSYNTLHNKQTIRTTHEDKRALGLALLLAVIAHVILLVYVKLPSNHKAWTPVIFDVQLRPVREQLDKVKSTDQATESDNRSQKEQSVLSTTSKKIDQLQKTVIEHTMIFVRQSEPEPVAEVIIKTDKTINPEATKQAISYGELLESAQQIVKEEAKYMPKTKDDGVLLSDRAFSPKLAQALAKKEKVLGVTKYADGMVKVVTSSGTEYCLTPSPQLIKGPFDSDPIPMTCP